METLSLKEYLEKREQKLSRINSEVCLLRSVKVPIRVKVNDVANEVYFFSEDYSLAENFKIRSRSKHLDSSSGYEGGYSREIRKYYPQFYFKLTGKGKIIPVYIQHRDFENDERIIIRSIEITEGHGNYSDMNRRIERDIDLEKAFCFFRQKGVDSGLLKKLETRIKQAGEFG